MFSLVSFAYGDLVCVLARLFVVFMSRVVTIRGLGWWICGCVFGCFVLLLWCCEVCVVCRGVFALIVYRFWVIVCWRFPMVLLVEFDESLIL